MGNSWFANLTITVLVAWLLWTLSNGVTVAAKAPVLVSGTTWQTIGTIQFKPIKPIDFKGAKTAAASDAVFGAAPIGTQGVFQMPITTEMGPAILVQGQYVQDALGKIVMTPDKQALGGEISTVVANMLPEGWRLIHAEVDSASAKPKTKSSKVGQSLKVNLKVLSNLTLQNDATQEQELLKWRFSYSGSVLEYWPCPDVTGAWKLQITHDESQDPIDLTMDIEQQSECSFEGHVNVDIPQCDLSFDVEVRGTVTQDSMQLEILDAPTIEDCAVSCTTTNNVTLTLTGGAWTGCYLTTGCWAGHESCWTLRRP